MRTIDALKARPGAAPVAVVEGDQQTSFDAVRQSAKITLSGNDVPDVVEFNKGNADGGQLAAQGLLTPITDVVAERGWDKKITGSMRSFAQYENGKAGSGDWYGITTGAVK